MGPCKAFAEHSNNNCISFTQFNAAVHMYLPGLLLTL